MNAMDKVIDDNLEEAFLDERLKTYPRTGPTIVQQLLGVAESVKGAQADIDAMQDEFTNRMANLQHIMQDSMDLLRDDMAERFEALRKNLGARP